MNDEKKDLVLIGLTDDHLISVAEAAEKRVEAVKKIKTLTLKVTNHQDWLNQGGKPYLAVSGDEKVARLFGISWRISEPAIENLEEGHFQYTYQGFFSMGTVEIEAIGTRSSKDAFFSQAYGEPIPATEIDRGDVKKAAFTNCIGNGVSRLLGIRNLTWEELKEAGIDVEKIQKVEYADRKLLLPRYGDFAAKAIDDPAVSVEWLRIYLSGAEKALLDPNKAKYKRTNEKLRDALQEELKKRDRYAEIKKRGLEELEKLDLSPSPAPSGAPTTPERTTEPQAGEGFPEDPGNKARHWTAEEAADMNTLLQAPCFDKDREEILAWFSKKRAIFEFSTKRVELEKRLAAFQRRDTEQESLPFGRTKGHGDPG